MRGNVAACRGSCLIEIFIAFLFAGAGAAVLLGSAAQHSHALSETVAILKKYGDAEKDFFVSSVAACGRPAGNGYAVVTCSKRYERRLLSTAIMTDSGGS